MRLDLPSSHASPWRVALLMALGVVVCGGVAGIAALSYNRSIPAPPPPTQAAPATAAKPAPAPQGPNFDVIRISPRGDAVMAGRAAPGAELTILDAGKPIGHTTADANGDWVFTTTQPLPPGARQLTLAERLPDGAKRQGSAPVLLSIPATAAAPPLAVALVPNGAPQILAGPTSARLGELGLGTLDYGEHGDVRFAGQAPPGATVRAYVDDRPVGTVTAGPDGRWTLAPDHPIAPGAHQLRLDQLGANGRVIARIELPFRRQQLAGQSLAPGSAVVQPGNSLWVIAHRTYGAGTRYTAIVAANKSLIRDPNLIYPGQVFALPAPAETDASAATPASPTMSK